MIVENWYKQHWYRRKSICNENQHFEDNPRKAKCLHVCLGSHGYLEQLLFG